MLWSVEQVLALAPDASSAKSGKDLSAARKWTSLGTSETCAWGTIQGSGKTPYQTCIDLGGPAFKCTCPSRKFPCKHGLGLFLILAQQSSLLTENEAPAWVTEWLAKRSEKEEKKASKAAEPPAPADPEAAAKASAAAEKRAVSREAKVTEGLDLMGVWLNDLVRSGFATLPGKPYGFWETPAARLVDAQAPGLARRITALSGITTSGENWPQDLLQELALLHLAKEGWPRISTLPPETQADLRATIGFNVNQEEVLNHPPLRDQWMVIGQRVEEEERLRVQRTWLFGTTTKHPALCLSFSAHASQPLDASMAPGTVFDGELVFYPGAWPLRALVKQRFGTPETHIPALRHTTIAQAHAFAAAAFSSNPWLERVPFALASVIPVKWDRQWAVRDEHQHYLCLDIQDMPAWKLMAISGGHPIALAGEWNGKTLKPLSAWVKQEFFVF